jgi:DNA invertase Pin-like site-specific DNA recombinase
VWGDHPNSDHLASHVGANCPSLERELIRARTDDGTTRAKAHGVRFGRPKSLTPHQRQEVLQRLSEGAVQDDLARTYGVSQATISRLAAPTPFEASAAVAP